MTQRFESLVEEYQHQVYSFSRYYLRNAQEAEDVTQEVLLRLWDNLDQVEATRAGAWLARVTRNACFDLLRRRKSQGRLFVDDHDDDQGWEPKSEERTSPETAAESWDIQRHVSRALDKLDEPYKSIVILREIQGLKYQEISESLEMPLNSVKTYLHRARRTLREQLREVYPYAISS